MLTNLFNETTLQTLAERCAALAPRLPKSERDLIQSAANSFQRALHYLHDKDTYYYHMAAASGVNSLNIAEISARIAKDSTRIHLYQELQSNL